MKLSCKLFKLSFFVPFLFSCSHQESVKQSVTWQYQEIPSLQNSLANENFVASNKILASNNLKLNDMNAENTPKLVSNNREKNLENWRTLIQEGLNTLNLNSDEQNRSFLKIEGLWLSKVEEVKKFSARNVDLSDLKIEELKSKELSDITLGYALSLGYQNKIYKALNLVSAYQNHYGQNVYLSVAKGYLHLLTDEVGFARSLFSSLRQIFQIKDNYNFQNERKISAEDSDQELQMLIEMGYLVALARAGSWFEFFRMKDNFVKTFPECKFSSFLSMGKTSEEIRSAFALKSPWMEALTDSLNSFDMKLIGRLNLVTLRH